MKALTVLRAAAALHAVVIGLQPVFAGIYLDGSPGGMRMHEPTGLAVVFVLTTGFFFSADFGFATGLVLLLDFVLACAMVPPQGS